MTYHTINGYYGVKVKDDIGRQLSEVHKQSK
jgi:hypothetical protein